MTQENPEIGSAPEASRPPSVPAAAGRQPPQPRARRKFGWVRKTLIAIVIVVVLLLILVILIPTLLSTGAGRLFVVGKINDNLTGHVSITDWSIGWTSGIRLDGVKMVDDANRQILQISHFSTKLSLVGAMHGQIHLGDTVVDGLDFFAERFPDGSLNFAKLAKASESRSGSEDKKNSKARDADASKSPSKLPSVDGELRLTNCRGTFQTDSTDAKTKQTKQDVLQFTSIAGSVKIPSINDVITDTLKIAVDSGGGVSGTISAGGHIQIAKNNVLVDFSRLNNLDVEQKITVSGISLPAAAGMFLPAPAPVAGAKEVPRPMKIEKGSMSASLAIGRNKDGNLAITPAMDAQDVVLSTNGVQDPIGAIGLHGSIVAPAATGASANSASVIDQIGAITLDNLVFSGAGSSVTLNGSIADFMHARNVQNVSVDLAYNLATLWKAYFPFIPADQQAKLKDAKVTGNFTKRIALGGSYPADTPFPQAITHLTAGGEIQIELFDGEGITLKNFIFPFALAGGKVAVAYADKPAGQNLPPPADLNDGKLNLAGLTVNVADPHMTVAMPPGTKLLDNINLNKQLTGNFGDWFNNPLLIDPDDSIPGRMSLVINACDAVPTDNLLFDQSAANIGVLDLTMTVSRIQLGNPTLKRVVDALATIGIKLDMKSLQGNLNPLHVHMARGITTEEMLINLAQHNRSLGLDGKAVMNTRMIEMTLRLPLITFGQSKPLPGIGDSIKLPLTGPANNPQFDVKLAIKKNFNIDPDALLKGFFDKGDKSNNGATPDQPKKDDPIDDILGKLKKKKKPDADK